MKVGRLLVVLVLAFQFWTVWSDFPQLPPLFGPDQADYENLRLQGMRHGHLYLDQAPDPRLLALPDPYDPAARAGLDVPHDVSLFRGHYYIYFGITPAITLLLPWRLLTGHDLHQIYAVLIFTGTGFLASASLWGALRRRYFPQAGTATALAGIAVLGFGAMTYPLLRRPGPWEEPIASGYCFTLLAFLCLERALRGGRVARWLGAAGACFGLAVGSRPDLALGAAAALPVLAWVWRRPGRSTADWAAPAAAFGTILAGLLGYNYARFGNPLEFGFHYQLNGEDFHRDPIFKGTEALQNAYFYFLAPAHWRRYFPFAGVPAEGPNAPYSIEYVYGLLANFPFVALAAAAPAACARRSPEERRALRALIGAAALYALGIAAGLIQLPGAAARYTADFAPLLALLAGLGLLGVERLAGGWRRTAWRTLGAVGAAAVVLVAALLNFQLLGLLRSLDRPAYDWIARAFDLPVYAWERLAGQRFGPLELTVRLPAAAPLGSLEPLVATGWSFETDCLFIRYIDSASVQLGFGASHRPVLWSPVLAADRSREHRLVVHMGSLFPPSAHPWFGRMDEFAAAGLSRWLRVDLDGQAAFDQAQDFYDGSPGDTHLGRNPGQPPTYGTRFSGDILRVRTLPVATPPRRAGGYGPRELDLAFPSEWTGAQPLVTTGRTGRGDTLSVRPGGPGCIRFGYDHWGVGYWESADVPAAALIAHRLQIRLPSLLAAPAGDLELALDGKTVWRAALPAYPSSAADLRFGVNAIGSSTCGPLFTGVIRAVRKL
ncbi:MAG TPA: hypothetical protein VHC86_06800 [Opitutaceae bacterium]|nr:hypothetical protein [Opitutaceae bacterium]